MNATQTLNPPHSTNRQPGFLHHLGKGAWGQEINDFLTLGRDPSCNYCLSDQSISARHARIERRENHQYLLRDLRSRNGTFVNGALVVEAFLNEGDRIQIGETHFRFSHHRNIYDQSPPLQSLNPKWANTLHHLVNLSSSDLPVLLLGPSGSGKELLAKYIHENSPRKGAPLVSVNCSALSESLIESELFGHSKGSFTGATENRKGAFEAARRGTLFLDEVGDLPLSLQPKLLRALENQEIRPVGSDESKKTDIRIVAATHHDLRDKVLRGDFRLDLYYRLNVLQVKAPALKDRMEDFDDLLMQFCKLYQVSFSANVVRQLKRYDWPGNIRELKNLVAKAKAYFGHKISKESQLQELLEQSSEVPCSSDPTAQMLTPVKDVEVPVKFNSSVIKDLEQEIIRKRLIANKGNQRQTALDLGIPKSTLHDRLKTYGIKVSK